MITNTSPCINTGTNLAWMDQAVDLAGNPRIQDGTADIGAFEMLAFQGLRFYLY